MSPGRNKNKIIGSLSAEQLNGPEAQAVQIIVENHRSHVRRLMGAQAQCTSEKIQGCWVMARPSKLVAVDFLKNDHGTAVTFIRATGVDTDAIFGPELLQIIEHFAET